MADVFLDTNVFIDLVEFRTDLTLDALDDNVVYLSALSFHIWAYTTKQKMPMPKMLKFHKTFRVADLNRKISKRAAQGPTQDYEDNIQLHTAVDAECDVFLTRDKDLLNLRYFGTMQIASELN